MQHVLRLEPFHHAVGDEFVVVGSLQIFGDGLEGHQEAVEVLVAVELFDFGQRAALAVTLPQFEQGRGIDRTFKMEMQLGLGQGDDERAGLRRHTLLIVD